MPRSPRLDLAARGPALGGVVGRAALEDVALERMGLEKKVLERVALERKALERKALDRVALEEVALGGGEGEYYAVPCILEVPDCCPTCELAGQSYQEEAEQEEAIALRPVIISGTSELEGRNKLLRDSPLTYTFASNPTTISPVLHTARDSVNSFIPLLV